jgi:CMP-N,N'-diacetyllegionaminic acid synthase
MCIVPARSGSKGLQNKNIRKLAGKPLIQWTLDQAIKSKLISKIVVSTDSDKVIKICKNKKYLKKIEVPFKRPKNISGKQLTCK